MRLFGMFALSLALTMPVLLNAQSAETTKPCIAADETIYAPGVDGVTPPQPLKPATEKSKEAPKIRGFQSFEMVVNSEGRVCNVKIVYTTNQESTKKLAWYIAENWVFKPAERNGKPVAVRLQLNLKER